MTNLGSGEFVVRANATDALQDLSAIDKALQQIAKTAKEIAPGPGLDRLTQQLKQQREQTLKTLGSPLGPAQTTPQIANAQRALQQYGVQMARATAENEKFNASQRRLNGPLGFLNRAIDKTSSALAGVGLNIRDVGIILGSGLLSGGIALIAREIVQVGIAIAKFVIHVAELGGAMNFLEAQADATFGVLSDGAKKTAQEQAEAFGVSERVVLNYTNRLARLFEVQGATDEAALKMSQTLVQIAEILRTTEGTTFEDAMERVRNTVAGNIEGLRELNILLTEQDLRRAAEERGIKLSSGALNAQERQYATLLATIDAVRQRQDDYNLTNESLARTQQEVNAQIEDTITELGQELAPVFLEALTIILNVTRGALELARAFRRLVHGAGELAERFPLVKNALVDVAKTAFPFLHVLDLIDGGQKKTGASAFELAEGERAAEEALRAIDRTAKLTADDLERIVDRYDALNRAIVDAEKNEARAELHLARTREDIAKRTADAQRDISEAYRARNRVIADANESLAEANLQTERDLFDARHRLEDVQIQVQRSVRDAEEKLADERIQTVKRIINIERELAAARRQNALDIVSSFRDVEDAQRTGDAQAERRARFSLSEALRGEDITKTQEQLAEEQADSQLRLTRLERDLSEERVDARRKVEDAERELARTIVDSKDAISDAQENLARAFEDSNIRIEAAQRKLAEAEIENNRALFDSRQSLLDVQLQGTLAVKDAREALEDLKEEFGLLGETLDEILLRLYMMNGELGKLVERFGFGGSTDLVFGNASGLQHGGRISGPRTVGEAGRELFIPDSPGLIVPNNATERILRALEGGFAGGPSITINQANRNDDELAFALYARMAAEVSQ